MGPLMEIARRYEMRVVEDAAQALGARQAQDGGESRAGTVGDLGCFSFFPSKNLGGFGDGGMVVTGDQELAERIRILRNHGAHPKYYHHCIGINSRLDALQAVVLRVKLKYLNEWTAGRRRNADRYEGLFAKSGLAPKFLSLPVREEKNFHIFNQFVIRVKKRDALREFLAGRGVGTEIYYPVPLHLQRCYQDLGYRPGDLPESEKAARETLALPIFPELTLGQQRKVVDEIKNFFQRRGAEKK
jgi:dTDP-4-amino-4,6-dideoxygalactose transaminase